jgi:hypothetical protein
VEGKTLSFLLARWIFKGGQLSLLFGQQPQERQPRGAILLGGQLSSKVFNIELCNDDALVHGTSTRSREEVCALRFAKSK